MSPVGELYKDSGGVGLITSQKMLTATLKTLAEDGLIFRTLYPGVPPKVEYSLTERGKSLLPHLDSLIGWAIENFDAILADRKSSAR